MGVLTKLEIKDAAGNYEFISSMDIAGVPGVKANYERQIHQGGDGSVLYRSTGITELTGFNVDLFWVVDDPVHDPNHIQHRMLAITENHEKVEVRVIFPDGSKWEVDANIEEFSGKIEKEAQNKASAKFLPSGKIRRSV